MAEDNVSLREYFAGLREADKQLVHTLFDEREVRLQVMFNAHSKALELAAEIMNERLNHLNALREEYTRKEGAFMTRELFDSSSANATARITALEKFQWKVMGLAAAFGFLSGFISMKLFG
jgi:hypothetical protein